MGIELEQCDGGIMANDFFWFYHRPYVENMRNETEERDRDQIMEGFACHAKELKFYFEDNQKVLNSIEQGSAVIRLLH